MDVGDWKKLLRSDMNPFGIGTTGSASGANSCGVDPNCYAVDARLRRKKSRIVVRDRRPGECVDVLMGDFGLAAVGGFELSVLRYDSIF